MSVRATVSIALSVKEVIDLGTTAAANPTVPYGISGSPYSYTADTSPVGTKGWCNTITLSSGAATVDLTSLTRTGLPTVTMSGLKIRAFHFKASSSNTSPVTIQPGATNGYAALGLGLSLQPGGEALIHDPTSTAVSGSHKTLDLASVDTDASVDIVILAGTA